MSVLEAPNKRVLTGRRRGRPRSVIATGAPPEPDATGLGHCTTLSPAILHVLRPGSGAPIGSGAGSGGGTSMQTSAGAAGAAGAHGEVLQLDWAEDDDLDGSPSARQHVPMGLGGALLCRALGVMGSLRRPLPIMASIPSNIPGQDRRRRASVHVLDEFALYDHHKRCGPMSPSPSPSPALRLPTPPPPPTMPPPPPPPSSMATVNGTIGNRGPETTNSSAACSSTGTERKSGQVTTTSAGQVTIQLTPSSPRCHWTSGVASSSGGPGNTPVGNHPTNSGNNHRCPATGTTIRSESVQGATCSSGRNPADSKHGWSCAWSRRRRRRNRDHTSTSTSRDDILSRGQMSDDNNEETAQHRLSDDQSESERDGNENDEDDDEENDEENPVERERHNDDDDDDEDIGVNTDKNRRRKRSQSRRRQESSSHHSVHQRRPSSHWHHHQQQQQRMSLSRRQHGSTAGLHRRCSTGTPGSEHADEDEDRLAASGIVEFDEVVGYGSECMAGVASAVIAAIITAGVVYWLYAWQVGGVT